MLDSDVHRCDSYAGATSPASRSVQASPFSDELRPHTVHEVEVVGSLWDDDGHQGLRQVP